MESHYILFSMTCKVSGYLSNILTKWDTQKKVLVVKNESKTSKRIKLVYYWFIIIPKIGGINKFLWQSKPHHKYADKLLFFLHWFFKGGGLVFRSRITDSLAGSICKNINGIIECKKSSLVLNPTKCKRKLRIVDFLNLVFAYLIFSVLTILRILFIYPLHLHNPCKPSLAGYFLIFSCSSCRATSQPQPLALFKKLVKTMVLLISFFFWSYGLNTGIIVCTTLFGLCALSFKHSLKR